MKEEKEYEQKVWDDPDLDLERGARNAKKWADTAFGASQDKASSAYREAKRDFVT